MVYQQIVSSQHRVSISASPFITQNRGKPAHYPVSFKLNGKVSTSTIGRNNYEYTYEATCLVDANVTVHQVHVVKYNVDDGDTAEVSIKQDNRYLHTKTYTYSTRWMFRESRRSGAASHPELDTFDNEKAVSFNIPGVKNHRRRLYHQIEISKEKFL